VHVPALITYANRGGEKSLRKLEMRLLGGAYGSRTADDLARYHGKMMIVDHRELYVFGFNVCLTSSTAAARRHPGRKLVQESTDCSRPIRASAVHACESHVAGKPGECAPELAAFYQGSKKELLIYDPEISDPAMIRLIEERLRAVWK